MNQIVPISRFNQLIKAWAPVMFGAALAFVVLLPCFMYVAGY